jgi:hypothetical protein
MQEKKSSVQPRSKQRWKKKFKKKGAQCRFSSGAADAAAQHMLEFSGVSLGTFVPAKASKRPCFTSTKAGGKKLPDMPEFSGASASKTRALAKKKKC